MDFGNLWIALAISGQTAAQATGTALTNQVLADIKEIMLDPEGFKNDKQEQAILQEQINRFKDNQNFLIRIKRGDVFEDTIVSKRWVEVFKEALKEGYVEVKEEKVLITESGIKFLDYLKDCKQKADEYKKKLNHEKHVFEDGLMDYRNAYKHTDSEEGDATGVGIVIGFVGILCLIAIIAVLVAGS